MGKRKKPKTPSKSNVPSQKPMDHARVEGFFATALGTTISLLSLTFWAKFVLSLIPPIVFMRILWSSEWTFRYTKGLRVALCACLFPLWAVLFGISLKDQYHKESSQYVLNDARRTRLIQGLSKPVIKYKKLLLSCPITSEDTCITAATYQQYFREAGWSLSSTSVERSNQGRPNRGITIGVRNVKQANSGWNGWTQHSFDQLAIEEAFTAAGLKWTSSAELNLPDDVLRIHFGLAP